MFHEIPEPIARRMRFLEQADARDRTDGTPRMQRLRQITPETGRFIALLAAAAPPGDLVEIGTSAGYSTLWLALAARVRGCRVVTFEVLDEKIAMAWETFQEAEVDNVVELRSGDARQMLTTAETFAFCFLDAEKEHYPTCYDLIVPRLIPGGILAADNAISHADELKPFVEQSLHDARVDSLVVPIGRGELVCRKM